MLSIVILRWWLKIDIYLSLYVNELKHVTLCYSEPGLDMRHLPKYLVISPGFMLKCCFNGVDAFLNASFTSAMA